MEDFELLIRDSANPDTSKRAVSETRLKFFQVNSPEKLSAGLLATSLLPEEFVSTQSLILYRSLLLDNEVFIYTPACQLFDLASSGRTDCYLKQLSHILVPLSIRQHFETDLLSRISSWLVTYHKPFQVFSLYLLELCTSFSYYVEIFKQNSRSVLDLLWKNLQDKDEEVKIRTCRTACFILKETQLDQVGQIIEVILNVIEDVKETNICPALEGIMQLLLDFSEGLNGTEEKLVRVLTKLTCRKTNTASRITAGNVLLELISPDRKPILETPYFVQELLATSFTLLGDVYLPLDSQAWASSEPGLESEIFELGQLILCHLADVVKDRIFTSYFRLFQAHIDSNHWLHKHSAIISVGLVSEDCYSSVKSSLLYFRQILFTYAKNEHVRLRWASLFSISLLCQYIPEFSLNFTGNIFEILMLNLNPVNPARVLEQGVRCFIDFSESVELEKSQVSCVLSVISHLVFLQSTPVFVLTQLVTCLAQLIEITDEVGLVQTLTPKLQSVAFLEGLDFSLRKSCFLCLGQTVKFGMCLDIQTLVENLLGVKTSITSSHLIYPDLMKCIGTCFMKLGTINDNVRGFIEETLENTLLDIPFFIENSDINEKYPEKIKKINYDENLANAKLTACYICGKLVKGLKEKFEPWVERTFNCMIQTLVQAFDNSTKKEALNTIIRIIKEVESRTAESYAIRAFHPMVQVIGSNTDPKLTLIVLKGIAKISKVLNGLALMTLSGASYFSTVLSQVIQNFTSLKNSENEIEAEICIDKVIRKSVDLISILLKSFRSEFKPIFLRFFSPLLDFLFKNSLNEILPALELLKGYLESTNCLDLSNKAGIFSRVKELASHNDSEVQQLSLQVLSYIN